MLLSLVWYPVSICPLQKRFQANCRVIVRQELKDYCLLSSGINGKTSDETAYSNCNMKNVSDLMFLISGFFFV